MIALITTEDLAERNQLMIKQLKNRYADPNYNRKFIIGVDRSKMRLYDVDDSAQDGLLDGPNEDKSVMDNSRFGIEDNNRSKRGKKQYDSKLLENFK